MPTLHIPTSTEQTLALTGNASKVLKINSGATGCEWATESGGGAADYPMIEKPALTRWVIPGWEVYNSANGGGITSGRIYYIPIFVSETTTYIRIGCYVGTSAAGTADLRIFNWSNGVPGTLVLSAGTVDTSTTGAKEITISQQLTRKYYFLAFRCSASPAMYGPSTGWPFSGPIPGIGSTVGGTLWLSVLVVDAAYADPAPAPTAQANSEMAKIYLREN